MLRDGTDESLRGLDTVRSWDCWWGFTYRLPARQSYQRSPDSSLSTGFLSIVLSGVHHFPWTKRRHNLGLPSQGMEDRKPKPQCLVQASEDMHKFYD